MVKARTIYVFEGNTTTCICRGFKLEQVPKNPHVYMARMKARGMFTSYFNVTINEKYISEPKNLVLGDKIQQGWEVIKIKLDFVTGMPFVPDTNPSIMAQKDSLQNEMEMWKFKSFNSSKNLRDINDKDLYHKKARDDIDFARKIMYNPQESFGFPSFYGKPPVMGQQPPQQEDE